MSPQAKGVPARLCLVTDGSQPYDDLLRRIEKLIDVGIRWVQFREPQRPSHESYELCVAMQARLAEVEGTLTVNDRLDIALAAGADGVHLGWRSVSIPTARRVLGSAHRIGFSTHSLDEARKAFGDGADYVTYGPVYETASKRGLLAPTGVDAVRSVVEQAGGPVVAIGGIDAERAPAVLGTGVAAVAVISSLMDARDPIAAARDLLAATESEVR